MTNDERPMSGDDEEHLAQVIVDSIQEAEKYLEEEGPLGPEAFLALDRADLAMEELGERLCELACQAGCDRGAGLLRFLENPPKISRQDSI